MVIGVKPVSPAELSHSVQSVSLVMLVGCSDGGMDVVSDLRLGWDSKYAQKFRFQVSLVINFNSRV